MSNLMAPRGHSLAVDRARQIAECDPRFSLNASQDVPQGKNNRVLAGRYDGQPAIFKYFHDSINRGGSARRKATEAFALRHWAGIDEVPALLAEFEDAVIIERKPGRALAASLRDGSAPRALLDGVAADVGRVYARMAACALSEEASAGVAKLCQEGRPFEAETERVLVAAARVCNDCDDLCVHGDTCELIRDVLPRTLGEKPLLYKYDNNLDNMLVSSSRLTGVIDFEMCYLGTETALLGAMFDTIPEIYPLFPNRPPWNALKRAYEASRGRPVSKEQFARVVAMAMLNHWRRIVDTYESRGIGNERAARFAGRFPVLKRLLREGDGYLMR